MQFDASVFSGDSAIQTASWGIRELLLVKEALLVCAEDEFTSTLYAGQTLVGETQLEEALSREGYQQ
jgi:hypothetical protein